MYEDDLVNIKGLDCLLTPTGLSIAEYDRRMIGRPCLSLSAGDIGPEGEGSLELGDIRRDSSEGMRYWPPT
jgi:hypothetical protein